MYMYVQSKDKGHVQSKDKDHTEEELSGHVQSKDMDHTEEICHTTVKNKKDLTDRKISKPRLTMCCFVEESLNQECRCTRTLAAHLMSCIMIATESRPLHTSVDGGGSAGTSRWGPKIASDMITSSTHDPDPRAGSPTVG